MNGQERRVLGATHVSNYGFGAILKNPKPCNGVMCGVLTLGVVVGLVEAPPPCLVAAVARHRSRETH